MDRLQKLISQAGVVSRRKAEDLMLAGRVAVNGTIVSTLGSKADWDSDRITVDGKPLRPAARLRYLLLYKPKAVVTTLNDPEGRPTIASFVRGSKERLYPVGRLDYHSEGLLLLTNDGEFANRVLHASYELPKTYWAKVAGRPTEEQLERLRRGIFLDGRRTAPAQIRWLSTADPRGAGPSLRRGSGPQPQASQASGRERQRAGVYRTSHENPWLEIVLVEGRYHQIRKMLQAVGHPVEKLKRVAIGEITIGSLKPGQIRPLSPQEVGQLQSAARGARPSSTRPLPARERRARVEPPPAAARRSPARQRADPAGNRSPHAKRRLPPSRPRLGVGLPGSPARRRFAGASSTKTGEPLRKGRQRE